MREEEKKRTSQNKVQQFFRKRWVFPAIYLMSAAVILTAVLWYQSISNNVAEDLQNNNTQGEDIALTNEPEAVEVNALKENFAMPALDPDAVTVVKKYYDPNASTEEQEAALVFYNNTYRMNKGIDIAREDQKQFDVVASLSGTVTKAEKDPILGHVVEIEHENDVVTVYQSLAEVSVQAGDKVEQNELIGKSGENLYNEEDGNHVHFEVRKAGTAVNPLTYMEKPVTSVEVEEASEKEVTEEEVSEEAPAGEGETKAPKEDGKSEESPEADKDAEKGETEGKEDSTQPEAKNSTLNS